MLQPIFLEPIYKEAVWGGNRLSKQYNKQTINQNIAESWELVVNDQEATKIRNSKFTLLDLYKKQSLRKMIFGKKCRDKKDFPLLIKIINAEDNLSVQIHPDNKTAKIYENTSGKSEMWYILECEKNARIIYGLKERISKEKLLQTIQEGKIEKHLQYVPIQKGDVVYIPAGTIHALLKGTIAYEVQQNSNVTYRIYDWERENRKLEIQKAVQTLKYKKNKTKLKHDKQNRRKINLLHCRFFRVDKLMISGQVRDCSNANSFNILTIVNGTGLLIKDNHSYLLQKGDTILIPAKMGKYDIQGKVEIIKSYL